MEFEWDELKNQANLAKHGFNFEFAVEIFDGPVREWGDPRPWGEERIVAIGLGQGAMYYRGLHATRRALPDNFRSSRADQGEVLMMTRKTLGQIKAEGGGVIDTEKFDGFTDADIELMIDENQDLAPRTDTLPLLLNVRDVRKKLGLSQTGLAKRLRIPVATIRNWEQGRTRTDPAIQALLRILDRIPASALEALEEPPRRAG